LTDVQWQRFRSDGIAQHTRPGAWFFRAGQDSRDMLLVESGTVEIIRARTGDSPEAVVAQYGPRQFRGEMNLPTAQAAYLNARATGTAMPA
jgi:thioredoxin reductase (NADPH)